jgi:hypothetical protein
METLELIGSDQMHLTESGSMVPSFSQEPGIGGIIRSQRKPSFTPTMFGILPGKDALPGGHTDGTGGIGIFKDKTLAGQPVQVRSKYRLITGETSYTGIMLIGYDKKDVWFLIHSATSGFPFINIHFCLLS